MDVTSPAAYCYIVAAADPAGSGLDVVGLTYLDPVDPISHEIRVNLGNFVSRLIMRRVTLQVPVSCPFSRESGQDVFGWEAVNLELAVRRGYVRTVAKWNPTSRESVNEIRAEFGFAVQEFFRPTSQRSPAKKWMKPWL